MSLTFTPVCNQKKSFSRAVGLLLFFAFVLVFKNASAQTLPHPDHIVILIEENQANNQVIGNSVAPYINQLANDSLGTIFANLFALTHPSQPNYLDFFAGDDQGVTTDNLPTNYPFTTANLARELMDKGLTFKTYSQDLPSVGSDVATSGQYVRKHNPVTNWVGTGTNQVPDTLNQPWTDFPTDFTQLPTVSYVVPNEDSDMHNGFGNTTIAAGDFWFKEHMQPFINWVSQPGSNTLFIYTFDEDDGLDNNNIPTVFYGPMVKPGGDATNYTLYSILRTIEDIYGLGYAGAAATSVPILDCWKTPTAVASISVAAGVKFFPNPASSLLQFQGDALTSANTQITITDVTGRQLERFNSNGSNKLAISVSDYTSGMYFYNLVSADRTIQSGKFIVAH
jgi:hypothetical protein